MSTLRSQPAVQHTVNCNMELVQVEFEYEYTARNGSRVSIKPNERYILVSRTNEHWWHVQKDQKTRPFYIPAKYVKGLSVESQGPKDLTNPRARSWTTPQAMADRDPVDLSDRGPMSATVSAKVRVAQDPSARSLSTHRMSTFSTPRVIDDIKHHERMKIMVGLQTSSSGTRDTPPHLKRCSLDPGYSLAPDLGDLLQFPPPPPIDDSVEQQNSEEWRKTLPGHPSGQSNSAQDSDIHQAVSTTQHSELTDLIETKLSEFCLKQSLNHTSGPIDVKAPSHTDQVVKESAQNAVYVNVAELRSSIAEPPRSSSPPFSSLPCRNAEGWEVHTDQESGQEYYYHPASGQTTWDNPLLLHMDPEPPGEEPACPPPPFSPAASSASTSPPTWTLDWEECLDEVSGRTYFYNPVSGESSWDAPEPLSPYPTVIGLLSGHTPHGEEPPPFPEEDYPADEYLDLAEAPEPHEKLYPHSFPKDYNPSHVTQSVLPRASLDRSAPTGWNLSIDPDGTWVFSSQHSPEQWIKSLDDRGQTYYYLRDGSKSEWNLPEAPVAPSQSNMGNGYGLDEVSAVKNWRHTIGPANLCLATEERKSFSTHRRNLSDNGSEGSSTDNSPEMGQPHVPTLEKAGILNKTKVLENGKRVRRKNWIQSWTVLHGGVLTFHKDPKSTSTGGSYKSNHIVPEVTVDLRGATIGWASKDKSSKKNVVELKSKNGVEFLIQYDTENIIQDWYKVLGDTIRQLVSPLTCDSCCYYIFPYTLSSSLASRTNTANSSSGETDQKKVRTKLMKFLMKRPTLQAIKEKGYIRDGVFGCHLALLCEREETTIPCFVEKCIKAVEKRGLEMDGLYRVSGNLAVIQKLRFKADHEELDLEDGQWEDIHVITGALKLFFRELPEPLFPFSHFSRFIQAIRIVDYNQKVLYMRELVESLPRPNHDTMELLFSHLLKVIDYGEENRMTVQNVAIVFGPTLLRPEMESSNMAMHMVFQNQIVELILNKHKFIFNSS
uniref:Rho GTPase activating protein 27 n=1 Tax=Esox lucius TaxID=8010 RepID=A0AAY5KK18_ESOLU